VSGRVGDAEEKLLTWMDRMCRIKEIQIEDLKFEI
jgi:hypothetical protein